MSIVFRPLESWPGRQTDWAARKIAPFQATYTTTMTLLQRELDQLRNSGPAVLQLALRESDLRITDGLPRAGAKPTHPGVVLSFSSKHGPLRYATDTFTSWQDNLRAIALGLEALRKVERYGITRGGEQYTGFRALDRASSLTVEDAARTVAAATDDEWKWDDLLVEVGTADKDWTRSAFRTAVKRRHPDVGGSHSDWLRLEEAYRLLMAS